MPVTAVAKKLQVKDDSTVLLLPDGPKLGFVGELPATTADPAEADVVLAAVTTPEEVDDIMAVVVEQAATARAVWLIYPKGGAAPVNRDTIWAQVVGLGWRLVSNVSVDERWSALRTRPLRPGESVETP